MDMDSLLKKFGCRDIIATGERFLDDPDFYLEIVTGMLGDPGVERLGGEIERRETQAAFDTAHMLKGIVGNCGISALYDAVSQIVELLRGGAPDPARLDELYGRMMEQKNRAEGLLAGLAGGR